MTVLSLQTRQAARAWLFSTLNDSLDAVLDRSESKTLQSRFECATSVISELMDTFQSAVKDFAEEWNAANRDPLLYLPTELTRKCFGLLDLAERITVSHVSRGWRRAALADGALWNKYSLRHTTHRSDSILLEALTTLISRSRPIPFRFSGFLPCYRVPPVFLDLISRNIDTMGELRLGDEFLQLSHLDAPVLKHLTCVRDSWTDAPELPKDWGAKNAPCLEYLDLMAVRLPADLLPIPTLRTFRAYVSPSITLKFVHVFPNLTKLELTGITQDSIPMLLRLPLSLSRKLLRAAFASTVDYSQFLHNLEPSRILALDIDAAASSPMALEIFVRQPSPSRIMEFTQEKLYLRDADREWTIRYRRLIPLDSWPSSLVHLKRFTGLRLQLGDARRLHELAGWDRDLPALRALALSLEQPYEHQEAGRLVRDLRESEPRTSSGIRMPVLESLTFFCKNRGLLWSALKLP